VSIHGLNYNDAVRLITIGRRTEQRNQQRKKAAGGCITSILTTAVAAAWGGWMLMLAVGVAHRNWLPDLPTIGYWTAALIVLLLRGTFSATRPTNKDGSNA
jgi:hypothetical protein